MTRGKYGGGHYQFRTLFQREGICTALGDAMTKIASYISIYDDKARTMEGVGGESRMEVVPGYDFSKVSGGGASCICRI